MVMAAPMGIVERYYDVADMLELRVLNLDYVGNSTLQLMRLQIDDSPTLSIQMGDEATIISIFNKNVLQLMRSVPYGRSTVANAIAEKRDISYEEALTVLDNERVLKESFSDGDYITGSLKYLANNISRVIDYYSTKNPDVTIQKAVMVTEGKSIRALETLLSYEIGLKIKKLMNLTRLLRMTDLICLCQNLQDTFPISDVLSSLLTLFQSPHLLRLRRLMIINI